MARKNQSSAVKTPAERTKVNSLYQLKITLLGTKPAIWRRIQVPDCSLDKLHEHIQTAMGWTNSHLHRFQIGEKRYADPILMEEDMDETGYLDSTVSKLSDVISKSGKRFEFLYEYDFGDGWQHEILFEGQLKAEAAKKYPICLEGERACPPEDVGGVRGYPEFIEAIQNADHERHEELLKWIGGQFDPNEFDPVAATKAMMKGLLHWK